MDYANLHRHHHQLQEQVNILGHSTSSATSSGDYMWNTSINTLNNDTDLYPSETIPNSRLLLPSSTPTFMASQDSIYGFDHATFTRRPSSNEPPPPNIKEETSDSFSKLRININPIDQFEKSNLVLSNLYKQGNNQIIGLTNHDSSSPFSVSDETLYCNDHNNINASFGAGFTSFGHVFSNRTSNRTLNRAIEGTLSPPFVLSSHEGFNNSQALDLLSSPRASNYHSPTQSSSHTTKNYSSNLGLYGEYNMSLGHVDHHNMQVSRSSPSNTSNNVKLGFFNEVTRTKRRLPSSLSDQPKDQSHNAEANKKSKSTSRSSNPPLKVRKEKLGDRISALHRLVAPFGKTDTASVLTEAIGYIQFLHDQVQTLSTPYMKSLQSKPSRKMQQVHGFGKDHEETEVLKMDLRSRGLCLVPLSCASYLNGFD